jgi:hypothetical protein
MHPQPASKTPTPSNGATPAISIPSPTDPLLGTPTEPVVVVVSEVGTDKKAGEGGKSCLCRRDRLIRLSSGTWLSRRSRMICRGSLRVWRWVFALWLDCGSLLSNHPAYVHIASFSLDNLQRRILTSNRHYTKRTNSLDRLRQAHQGTRRQA